MSDFKAIIDAIKRIETTLIEQFGAEGRGLHEKLSSVEERIPPKLQRSIRYLATVRNKAMHEHGYEIDDPAGYVRQATQAYAELLALATQRGAPSATNPSTRAAMPPDKLLVFSVAALILGCAWYYANVIQSKLDGSVAQVDTFAEVVRDDTAKAQVTTPPSIAQRNRGVELHATTSERVTEGSRGNSPNIVNPDRSTASAGSKAYPDATSRSAPGTASVGDLMDEIAAGRHAGIGNEALRVDDVQFAFKKGIWRTLEPQITLKLTNTSDKIVSTGRAEAMLFLNGRVGPSVQAKGLFLYFGDRGLPAGESRSVQVSLDREHNWQAPDILNARHHTVAVRVSATDDGMARKFGGSAPVFPWKLSSTKLKALDSEPQNVDMRSTIAAGESVGAGNAAVRLGTPSMKFGDGSFGRDIEISVEVENVSDRTVSWIKADAHLFINGDAEPVIGDKEVVSFYLGERGLAVGERRQVKGKIDTFKSSQWTVPDVMSANSRLLALRVVKTDDGMRQEFGGMAKQFPWGVPKHR